MSKGHLRPCPSCARHVRVSEPACVFCGAALGEALRASPAPVPPSVRLSRAALFALGTSALSLGAACGASTGALLPPGAGDAGETENVEAGYDAGSTTAPYGLPPTPEDAGADTSTVIPPKDAAPPPVDSSFEDVGNIQPPYGLPPYGLPP
jgi:hypothetical protein